MRYRIPTPAPSIAPVRWVFGNWDISGIFQAQSGNPFDIRTPAGVDRAGVGAGSGSQLYDQRGDPEAARTSEWAALPNGRGLGIIWFDRNAFAEPALGTFATTQEKNSLRQPGFWDINLSLRKGFGLVNSAHRFDFRLEVFNVMNRPRLGAAVPNPTSADFGYIVSKVGSRTMQVGMQYVF
jgi:hypothetical protein